MRAVSIGDASLHQASQHSGLYVGGWMYSGHLKLVHKTMLASYSCVYSY